MIVWPLSAAFLDAHRLVFDTFGKWDIDTLAPTYTDRLGFAVSGRMFGTGGSTLYR